MCLSRRAAGTGHGDGEQPASGDKTGDRRQGGWRGHELPCPSSHWAHESGLARTGLGVGAWTGESGDSVRNAMIGVLEHQESVQGSQILGAGTLKVRVRLMDNVFHFKNSRYTWSSGAWTHC